MSSSSESQTPVVGDGSRILVLDFGAQYSQLIARRVREEHIYCELHPATLDLASIRKFGPTGIILSGGPSSVLDADAPQCDPGLTVVVAPQVTSVAVGQSLRYTVERQGPLLRDALPIRTLQRFSSSTVAYDAAVFEAHVVVDGGSSRGGRSELVQGVAILVASSNQGRWN